MSNIPLMFNKKMTDFFAKLTKGKKLYSKIVAIFSFRPNFLAPVIGLVQGLTDPISGLIIGCTQKMFRAILKLREKSKMNFHCVRIKKAEKTISDGIFKEEIIPVLIMMKKTR